MEGFKDFILQENCSNSELVNIYLHEPNKKIKELAQTTGKSIGEIYRILHSYNISPNRQKTNHQHVVNFANFGFNINQIAELTGYTTRNVRYILSKENNG